MPIIAGATVFRKFTTRAFATGVPTTLAGTPAVSIYKDNNTTQSTTGVVLIPDFDSVTGLNHVSIDTSADGTFYSSGSHFDLVITTGTVGGTSVVGEVVGDFDLGPVPADVQTIKGQAVTCSAGVTVNVNVGTTQPVNFTGTGASALVKSDSVDWGGTAVGSAVVTANTTQFAGQTITCGAGVTIDPFVGNATAFIAVDAQGRVLVSIPGL